MLTRDQTRAPAARPPAVPGERRRPIAFVALAVVLAAGFSRPLYHLIRYALHSDLFSYVLLIPFISLYLIWPKRSALVAPSRPAWRPALLPLLGGLGLLTGYTMALRSGWRPKTDDYLAVMTLSFLSILLSGSFIILGSDALRAIAFPVAFLFFMAPFPSAVLNWIESFFQHASADAAYALLTLTGMPVLKQGTELQMPGFSMRVATECSGIHSTLVLFITSLLAGQLLLRTAWARTVLPLAVIPLAILRNGLRIFTLGELCVNVDPRWIDSALHHRGGPLWFALSLVPFFLLLWLLRKSERRTHPPQTVESKT